MASKSRFTWIVAGAFLVATAVLLVLYRPPAWNAVPDATLQAAQGRSFELSTLSRKIWIAVWPDAGVTCDGLDAGLQDLGHEFPPRIDRVVFVAPGTQTACLPANDWRVLTAPAAELRSLASDTFGHTAGSGTDPGTGRPYVVDRGGHVRGGGDRATAIAEVDFLLGLDGRPRWHATLNGISALLLSVGYLFVRAGHRRIHAACMISASLTTAAFLASYLYYHYHAGAVGFQGQGGIRLVYFGLLLSHTVLAAFVAPLVLLVFRYAVTRRFNDHRRLARRTLPLWLYVSVTGVLIYLMLYVWYPH